MQSYIKYNKVPVIEAPIIEAPIIEAHIVEAPVVETSIMKITNESATNDSTNKKNKCQCPDCIIYSKINREHKNKIKLLNYEQREIYDHYWYFQNLIEDNEFPTLTRKDGKSRTKTN